MHEANSKTGNRHVKMKEEDGLGRSVRCWGAECQCYRIGEEWILPWSGNDEESGKGYGGW